MLVYLIVILLVDTRKNGCFFLGPAGTCLGYTQLLSFSIWGMAALRAALSPPPKSSLQSSKSLEHWIGEQKLFLREVLVYGCQEQLLFWCLCHLTHQDATCPPSLALDPWRTGRVLERSLGVQDIHIDARNNLFFSVPFRKCHLTHQDSTCPPSLELNPWRTGRVPDRSLHFNVSNNSTLWNYLKQ